MRYITKEEVKELLPIIQALAEGKMIQDKIEGLTDWVDTDEINLEFDGQKLKHRIKPESEHMPFKNVEECLGEMQKHQPVGWLKTKTSTQWKNNVVDIEYAANVTVKLTNTVITFVDNRGNERTVEAHKVLLDKNGNHSFYVDGGTVTMNRIKRIVYNSGIPYGIKE